MGACASKPKVLGDKLRDKPRNAPSRSASKSNGGIPPSPSTRRVTSMNEDKHTSSDYAISNGKSMRSSTRVEDSKKYGEMREVLMTRKEDDEDEKKYGDKDEDEQDDGNDKGDEEEENDQEMTTTSEENEEDENGDEFEDEQVTTTTQKDGHDDDEVRDENEFERNNCNEKETILNRSMNECEDVDLKPSIYDRKSQMDDISPRNLHDSHSSKDRDNDHVNRDHNININLHSEDVVNPLKDDQNIFMEKGDVNKSKLHGTTPTKRRGNEDQKFRSISSNEEFEGGPINPIKSPPPTYNSKSVVIEAANPTGLQTLFSSSPAKPTKDVVVLDQHPTLHPAMVLKDPPPSLIKKDVDAKKAEVRPRENSTNRCTNTAIHSTFAF